MHNEQLDDAIVLGKPGKGKSFKVMLDDMKENPEKYNKCVCDYYGSLQKENEEIRKQLLENGIYIGQDTGNASNYVSKSIEYYFELVEEIKKLGGKDEDLKLITVEVIHNSIKNNIEPKDVAWAILQ